MTGLEYIRTVCPTTKVGKDPLREDVMDAFEDGIAEGWKQCKEKQWKPTEEQITVINDTIRFIEDKSDSLSSDYLYNKMKELLEQLKAL